MIETREEFGRCEMDIVRGSKVKTDDELISLIEQKIDFICLYSAL